MKPNTVLTSGSGAQDSGVKNDDVKKKHGVNMVRQSLTQAYAYCTVASAMTEASLLL